jgi:ubiquinone/menaquinone biosynthesis C-methylase UbiE
MNMKKEWDQRALKNAYHFVSTFREEWDDESFYRWGEVQTQAVIDKFFEDLKIDPSDLVVLEIGCGAGRMSRALASRFKLVYAYDVSDRYIQIAKKKNSHLQNVVFRSNDGLSFPEIADESIDFCFSGWTMQHMPTKEVVIRNIEEVSRVLKNGGLYKIDSPIGTRSKFKEMIISRMVRFVPPLIGHCKLKLTPTYRGVRFTEKEILAILLRCNLSVNTLVEDDGFERFYGKRSMNKWFYGKKENDTY